MVSEPGFVPEAGGASAAAETTPAGPASDKAGPGRGPGPLAAADRARAEAALEAAAARLRQEAAVLAGAERWAQLEAEWRGLLSRRQHCLQCLARPATALSGREREVVRQLETTERALIQNAHARAAIPCSHSIPEAAARRRYAAARRAYEAAWQTAERARCEAPRPAPGDPGPDGGTGRG